MHMWTVLVFTKYLGEGDAADVQSKLRSNCLRCPDITSSGLLPGVTKASLEVLLLHTEVVGLAVQEVVAAPGWQFELCKDGVLARAEQLLLLGVSAKLCRPPGSKGFSFSS